ncbi:MAG: hypothetical protein LUG98_01440 [Tannerellaceae bacterium]|nr:hypothetical protein [Tannerellaceae bacterium]
MVFLLICFPTRIYHPFYELIYPGFEETDYNRRCLLSIEGLMYALLFNRLMDKPHEELAQLFHYYLLILGYTNRLLVQQTHQYGFTQFQKLTLNELREQSEFHYRNRFFQLQGNDLRNIHVLEGRFAPKDTRDGVLQLLKRIRGGWKELVDHVANTGVQPELKLAAHFIKRADDKKDQDIRHKSLRYKVWNQALILAYMKKNQPKELTDVVAVDAAASEFDASPEVFAPAFRMLRRKGFNHFTYHAGEDFFHILTGLRSIYEAVVFNDLRSGDRIGHATATGISPSVWKANVGSTILMRRGEYLDDLVFVYHLIMERVKKNPRLEAFKSKIPFLANHIQEYGSFIYHVYAPLKVYENAWMLRKYCPMTLKTQSLELESAWQVFWSDNPLKPAEEIVTFDFEEWCEIREEVQEPVTDESVRLLMKYHNQGYHEKYNEIIEVNIEECFTLKEIELLQLAILDFLHEKEIVIETLPTSNVRIGHHSSFHTYHLWNWLQWEKQGHSIPPIVVGTDDTGIFATNIFNEFANIYCFLTHTKKLSHNHAMEIIQRLERNARIYRFE